MATIRPGTEAAALLEQTWLPGFKRQTNEAGRIFPSFEKPDGVTRIGNALNISKVLRQPANTLAAGDTGKTLNYQGNVELNVQVAPTFTYGAVEISEHTMTRMLRYPALQRAYRDQIIAGLVAEKDARAGLMAVTVSTVRGGIAQNFDLPFLLDGIGLLGEQVRELWEPGSGQWAFLHIHPRQYKHMMGIDALRNAQVRGDGKQVIRTGWQAENLGLMINISGNVYVSGGVAHNFLHIKESHVYGLNEDFKFKAPQEFELVTRLIAYGECGFAEVWDEYAINMQTSAA